MISYKTALHGLFTTVCVQIQPNVICSKEVDNTFKSLCQCRHRWVCFEKAISCTLHMLHRTLPLWALLTPRKAAYDKITCSIISFFPFPDSVFYGALTALCQRQMGWKRVGILCNLQLRLQTGSFAFFCPAFTMRSAYLTTSQND